MSEITNYINKLEGKGKRHVLLIITPKGEYPNQFSRREFQNLENAILEKPKSYISLFEDDENEIMEYAAFRLFLKPVICDNYRLHDKSTIKLKRLNEEEIKSFTITKHFYETVPYGKKKEQEAINDGIKKAEQFKKDFPIDNYEFASVKLDKNSDEANIFIDLNLKSNKNDKDIYFDFIYVH
ncbi:hypothetical protein VBD025_00860 [Virgibacillus flavescens]|uniref:hypothetical protein n=1 Tax=Virgibacillus flavescens TaxID=1611422 RepID=UPI003D33FAEE